MILTDADELRLALMGAEASLVAEREHSERLQRERDEARAEVERLRRIESKYVELDAALAKATDACPHPQDEWTTCSTCWLAALRNVAERQREACAKQFEGEGASISDRGNAKWVRATPLVTEGKP